MRAPTIHLNGTSRDALVDGFLSATDALHAAISAVQTLPLNGRDYYPQGASAAQEAFAQQAEMLRQLNAMRDELYTVAEQISDQP